MQRKRLFRALDHVPRRPILWVCGPGGSGKTTLASSYVDHHKRPCVWYQMDQGDADPATFFHYLSLAVQKAVPRRRKRLPRLTPELLAGLPVFALRYFETLFELVSSPAMMVFDNYQDVPLNAPVHPLLSEVLRTVPDGIQFLFLSRTGPPPVMARLQANDAVLNIAWEDLVLTKAETQEFVGVYRRQKSNRLSRQAVHALYERTGGWAAGLVLLLKGSLPSTVPTGPLDSACPEVLFDYFNVELFEQMEPAMQAFLLKTALLPDVEEQAAQDLTGNGQAGRLLAQLARDSSFTVQQGDAGKAYQYHPFFREFLLHRAQETFPPDDWATVRHMAARVLEQARRYEDALALLADLNAWDAFVPLLERSAPKWFVEGRIVTLETWLRRLPSGEFEKHPWIQYWLGMCLLGRSPSESQAIFHQAFRLFKNKENVEGLFLTWAAIADSIFFSWHDFVQLDPWIAELESLMAVHPEFPSLEVEIRVVLGMLRPSCCVSHSTPPFQHGLRVPRPFFDTPQTSISRLKLPAA